MNFPEYDNQDFRSIRKRLGLTLKQMGALFGVTYRTIIFWENGEKRPLGPALRLFQILDTMPDVFNRLDEQKEDA